MEPSPSSKVPPLFAFHLKPPTVWYILVFQWNTTQNPTKDVRACVYLNVSVCECES